MGPGCHLLTIVDKWSRVCLSLCRQSAKGLCESEGTRNAPRICRM